MIQIYYCPFCGEEYNNKVNLHKHIGDDHCDENQSPDEILRCPLCEAVFYHLDAYELHLSFHSCEDVYNDENEILLDVTDFSLESVPPIMEKVEEESKNAENEGIDKFLQLIMDESRESGNADTNDKHKSKKHKKHKKSRKAAITLDEFLNMNKDVFGDGLDVQGIEEVPTQQVLKKHKGKKEAKPLSASAIAKLKKQGITVKSNSGINSPVLKTNRSVTVNTAKAVSTRIPVKVPETNKTVAASNELLSKLLNQGNSQIKIVKKSSTENVTKDKINNITDNQETVVKSVAYNTLSSHTSDEGTPENKDNEIVQGSELAQPKADLINNGSNINETDMQDILNTPTQKPVCLTANKDSYMHIKPIKNNENNDLISENTAGNSGQTKLVGEVSNTEQHDTDTHMSDKDDTYDPSENLETKASQEEDIPNPAESKPASNIHEHYKQENSSKSHVSKMPLDALKHLSGLITVKSTQNSEERSNITDTRLLMPENDTKDENIAGNISPKVAKILGKNAQNLIMRKCNVLQVKSEMPTKSVDTFKNINNQLTIKQSSTSTCKDDSESDDTDNYDSHDNMHNKSIINENDNANFKTPTSVARVSATTAKPIQQLDVKRPIQPKNNLKEFIKEEDNVQKTFNMDILKRLTNVTAKPVSKITNNIQVPKLVQQSSNSPKPLIHKAEKNKEINQEIEIFNIDDSDSDQELPDEEFCTEELENFQKNSDPKIAASVNVLKNLSKNITIKPPNSPNNKNIRSPGSNDHKINIAKTQINVNLNHTLKKLGNNISIKSQYSSPDTHRYQMEQDDDMDDHYEMNDEESDSETTGKVKITEVHEDDKDLPSDTDMEYNENVIIQSPVASNSENEETRSNHSDEDIDDYEGHIKANMLPKEKSTSECLDNFKRNNRQLTIKSLNERSTDFAQVSSPENKKEDVPRVTKNVSKNISTKQVREAEKQDNNEGLSKNGNQSAAVSSSASQKVNQVNTVKTLKTFQSETIIEEITTTVTKTIRTVNQSTKQVAQNATVNKTRLMSPNQAGKPLQGMMVRNAQAVGTKIRNASPSPRPPISMPTKATGHLVPVRPQNQIVPRQQGIYRPSGPGPSNIRKTSPQSNVQRPVIGKPLKISPLAMNQSMKRPNENMPGNLAGFKKPKDSIISPADAFPEEQIDDATVNYSSASSSRSDYSATATKILKGKSIVTSTQARSEQHSEQHISKLNNMSGLKIVRTSAKQASQMETRNDVQVATKRTTMDAIERLQKQGLLVKKPRIDAPDENEQYNYSNSDEEYEEN